ncbi:TPA: hypothetical protein ACJIK4_003130 [Kluyvera cryocrescens]
MSTMSYEIGAINDGSRYLSFADDNGDLLALTTASEVFQVGTAIQDTNTLAVTDDTPIDGQATFTVIYL